MNIANFRHQSDSRYCFSLDASHVLLRLAISKEVSPNFVSVIYGDPMTYSAKHQALAMHKAHEDSGFHYYDVVVEVDPVRLMYIFEIVIGGTSYYLSESGVTDTFPFHTSFINAFQFVGENKNDFVLEPKSWKGRVVYQIFPERFASREDPSSKEYVNESWDKVGVPSGANVFMGGDLYGIIDKLDYLQELGVGVLYLTPIHPSPSNHKYDVLDYFEVDEHFGGKKAFKELVKLAHKKKIKVMMDLVFNHTSDLHPLFQDVVAKGKESPYYDWYFIKDYFPEKKPLNYRCFGYFPGMPKLNTNNRDLQRYLISIGLYWLKEFDVDGFRLDVSEGVSHDFWNRFKIALKDVKSNVLLIGENWFNAESYLGPNQFDGVMNYPFLDAVSAYCLKQDDAKTAVLRLDGLLMRYKAGHNDMMLNILSSHDVQRFRTLCKGDVDLSLLGYALLVFYPGHPMIYYGEEIFMECGRDPDNRRGMAWNSPYWGSPEAETFKKLLHLRKEEAFINGETAIGSCDDMLYVRRLLTESNFTLYCNLSVEAKTIPEKIIFGNKCHNNTLEPGGFAVCKD